MLTAVACSQMVPDLVTFVLTEVCPTLSDMVRDEGVLSPEAIIQLQNDTPVAGDFAEWLREYLKRSGFTRAPDS